MPTRGRPELGWPFAVPQVVQAIEALLPGDAIALHPVGNVLQPSCLEPARPPLRLSPLRDQPCVLQHLEVLRYAGKAQIEGLGQFRDRRLAPRKPRQDRPARGIRKGPKRNAQYIGSHSVFCHMTN